MMFRIKNWSSLQSYKDRNPPWIRLHKKLIDNMSFQRMSADARALLPMIWLMASEDEDPVSGMLRIGYEEITFRLRLDHKIVKSAIDEIIRAGFIERADDPEMPLFNEINQEVTEPLRNRYETVTQRQRQIQSTETDKKEDTIVSSKNGSHAKPVGLSDLNITHIEDWLEEKRKSGLYISVDEDRLLERFKNYCTSKNKTYKNYIAAFKNSFEWENVPQKKPNQNKLDPETLKLFKGGGL